MPAKRKLTMRQLRQMLRLARDGASSREIARVLGVARSTVQENLKRAADAGLSWPLPGELTDDALEQRLFDRAGVKQGTRRRPEPNWAELVIDLKKPGVTMMVLWEEYRAIQPGGYGYSRFCELFRGFERRLQPSMRQDHVAGDKVFVDYSGKKIAIVDPHNGEIREAEIFVAVLGASNFTYAEATWTQTLPDWIGAHVRMFRFFGGVPRLVVPDNLKAGVHKASFYDPELNRSYGMMASHYGVGVLPARPRRPKDKAKVENGVRFAQTCILGRLRHQTFFSLADANAAIAGALDRINDHVIRRLGVTRRHLFETIERQALAPLPGDEYEFAEWRLARVGVDYHVEHEGFFYSVPHGLIRAQVDVARDQPHDRAVPSRPAGRRCISAATAAVGTAPIPITCPARTAATRTGRRTASAAGRPRSGRTPKRLVTAILAHRPHPEQGFRTCLGVLRLFRDLEAARAEAVSARALRIGALTYKSIASILANRLGRRPATTEPEAVIDHANLRGPGYFH